jgi:hypothetical protein
MFDQLKKLPIVRTSPHDMFTKELREKTKFMALDTWLNKQLRQRKNRLEQHPKWSKEKLEGYEQGLTDMALDAKVEIKKLNGEL